MSDPAPPDAPTPDDLQPRISRRALPAYIARNRERHEAQNEADRERLEPRVDEHIRAHRLALGFLDESHQWIADNYDFDLAGGTRPAAVWQMAGRCIGLSRLTVDALSLGYTAEVLHLARAIHEADRLLDVFTDPEEADLLRRWLADEGQDWVRPKNVRQADARAEERLAAAMEADGDERVPSTADLTKEIYHHQSAAAHHRRRWTQDAVAPMLRTMFRGVTPSWVRRAGTTAAMLGVVEESVITVGGALGLFYGSGWYRNSIKPIEATFAALRKAYPLT